MENRDSRSWFWPWWSSLEGLSLAGAGGGWVLYSAQCSFVPSSKLPILVILIDFLHSLTYSAIKLSNYFLGERKRGNRWGWAASCIFFTMRWKEIVFTELSWLRYGIESQVFGWKYGPVINKMIGPTWSAKLRWPPIIYYYQSVSSSTPWPPPQCSGTAETHGNLPSPMGKEDSALWRLGWFLSWREHGDRNKIQFQKYKANYYIFLLISLYLQVFLDLKKGFRNNTENF